MVHINSQHNKRLEGTCSPPIVVRFAHFTTIDSALLSPVMRALARRAKRGASGRVKVLVGQCGNVREAHTKQAFW
jgi:hypothetical protein